MRNLGWPLAQGSFIHFLDDDDLAPAGHYSAVKRAFESRPEIGVAFGQIEPFGDPSRHREQMQCRRRMQAKYLKEKGAFEFFSLALFARTVLRVC